MTSGTSRLLLLVTALLVTWLVWGASFLAVAVALDDIPPLLLMSSRFVFAGVVATALGLLLARRAGHALPCRVAWRDATLVGIGWIAIGMGATGWAGTRLPTGICALLVAMAPLWMAIVQAGVLRTGMPSRVALAGLATGFGGVALLLAVPSGGPALDVTAAIVLAGSTAAWAGASVFATRAVRPRGLVLGVGMQMLTGGLVLLGAALVAGEHRRVELDAIGVAAAQSWTYLVIAASLGGFLAYGWLLEHVGTTVAATHAFVNPVVAIALGALLLGEPLGMATLSSAGAVVLAVVLLLADERRGRALVQLPRAATRPARGTLRPHRPVAAGPAFAAARRGTRPWVATDGMDALSIDEALDQHAWDQQP